MIVLQVEKPRAVIDVCISVVYLATHGTGINFGNLATFVTSFELVTGTGEVSLNLVQLKQYAYTV